MLFHVFAFFGSEGAGLAEDLIADPNLADVMEQAGEVKVADFSAREAHFLTESDGDSGDALAMSAGVGVLRVDRGGEAADDAEEGVLEIFMDAEIAVMAELEAEDDLDDSGIEFTEWSVGMKADRHQPVGGWARDGQNHGGVG
jgi:hypothetical protein